MRVLVSLAWLGACGSPEPAPPPAPAPPPPVNGYAGSSACAGCHPAETAAWSGSHHHLAEREPLPGDPPFPHGDPVRVIGVDPLRQVLLPGEGGRLQVHALAWDPAASEWFSTVADDRQAGEWGHWTGRGMNWNARCAACHVTGFEKRYDPVGDTFDSRFAEMGLGCEACHGPSSVHAAGGPPPAAPVDGCAPCHASRAELVDAAAPGRPLLDQYAPSYADLGDAWYPDGQVRDEVFEWAAFAGSAMAAAGVTCLDCHDAHAGGLRAEGDALCLRCHGPGPDPAHLSKPAPTPAPDHSHHATVGCVGCHMPETTFMQRDRRRDHGFTLPDPALHRLADVPDACTRCHTDRTVGWAEGHTTAWYGDVAHRDRALAIHRARNGDPAGLEGVLALALDPGPARWRATGHAALAAYLGAPGVVEALARGAADPDPLVRFAAVSALAGARGHPASDRAVAAAFTDPVRAVRVAAARSMPLPPGDRRLADWYAYLDQNLDQPLTRLERGSWAVGQGRIEGLADLERAVQWDPGSAAPRMAYAVALAAAGRDADALAQLVEATRIAPEDASAWHSRALAEAGTDRKAAAASLERAVALDPGFARAWMNLGLLRHQAGDGAGAVDALRRAVAADPGSPDPGYALATVLRDLGRAAEARAAADALLARFPDHPGARALAGSLRP